VLLVSVELRLHRSFKPVDAMVLVPSMALTRLPRELGLTVRDALWYFDAVQRWPSMEIRQFVVRAQLTGSPLDRLSDREVIKVVRQAIRDGRLIAVQEGSEAGETTDDTAEQRRLVMKIERLCPLRHGGRQYKLVADADLAQTPGRNSYEVTRHDEAQRVLDALARQPGTEADLAALLGKAREKLTADWRPPQSPDGLVLLRKLPTIQAPGANVGPALTPSQIEQMQKTHWVEFRIRDVGARPMAGVHYTLTLPDGSERTGTLGSDGRTRDEGQPSGSARLVLTDIDEASWGAEVTEANDPVDLTIQTSGIDAGAAVTFEVFRLYRERPGDVVAKLDGTIDDSGAASVSWQPDSIEEPGDRYVFKATVAGIWRKSAAMRVVQRVASATWSSTTASAGDALTLRADVRGVEDGESATFTIFQKFWLGIRDPDIDEIEATVTNGVAEGTWTVPDPDEPPAFGSDGCRHLFFVAESGGVFATSDLLTVVPPEPDVPDESDEPSESASAAEPDSTGGMAEAGEQDYATGTDEPSERDVPAETSDEPADDDAPDESDQTAEASDTDDASETEGQA
jgi:hypothetical protein